MIAVASAVSALAACSVYQSSGRKTLETGAFTLAGNTAQLTSCAATPAYNEDSHLYQENAAAWIYQQGLTPTVDVILKSAKLACQYQFISEDALSEHWTDVVTVTEQQAASHD